MHHQKIKIMGHNLAINPQTNEYRDYAYPGCTAVHYNPADDYPYPIEAMRWVYDGLHPTDAGHARIAEMLVKVMKKY